MNAPRTRKSRRLEMPDGAAPCRSSATREAIACIGEARLADGNDTPHRLVRVTIPPSLLSNAEKLYRLAMRRKQLLGPDLFGDPAWHMLLDVFISEAKGTRLSVSDVCIGSLASFATALRYLAILTESGLVTRSEDRDDRRRTFVTLAQPGLLLMLSLLEDDPPGLPQRP